MLGGVLVERRSDLCADLQDAEQKLRQLDERFKALQKETAMLERRDNELLLEKKNLCELKGKKRQLEQKISTKQDRSDLL